MEGARQSREGRKELSPEALPGSQGDEVKEVKVTVSTYYVTGAVPLAAYPSSQSIPAHLEK